jgi:hypothetical protein
MQPSHGDTYFVQWAENSAYMSFYTSAVEKRICGIACVSCLAFDFWYNIIGDVYAVEGGV